jgi:hypothetical protein
MTLLNPQRSLKQFKSRFDQGEERISEPVDRSIEIIVRGTEIEKT